MTFIPFLQPITPSTTSDIDKITVFFFCGKIEKLSNFPQLNSFVNLSIA